MEHPFGIDFGGTGIKGAPVDLEVGDFAHERLRIDTPRPATPQAVAQVFQEIVGGFAASTRPVGVTVPGIVQRGVVRSAANIDKSWMGEDADAIFTEALGREVHVVNDADAAGLAEAEYGAAKGRQGLVMVITLGTGIGSAMIFDGQLVPNSEMGHLERLFTPDLFVSGGGVSKSWDRFGHLIEVETEMVPATLQNRAGIVGAALVAHRKAGSPD